MREAVGTTAEQRQGGTSRGAGVNPARFWWRSEDASLSPDCYLVGTEEQDTEGEEQKTGGCCGLVPSAPSTVLRRELGDTLWLPSPATSQHAQSRVGRVSSCSVQADHCWFCFLQLCSH